MAGADSVIKYLSNLNQYEQQKVLTFLEERLVLGSLTSEVKNEVRENRFSSGKVSSLPK